MVLWFVVVGEANSSLGILPFVGEINHVVSLLERWRLHWGKYSRIFEVVSAGEMFSEIKLLLGVILWEGFWGDLSLPLVTNVYGIARKCLLVCKPSSGLTFKAPSDGDGDLLLVISAILERFLGILIGLPHVCWIVTCHVPFLIGDLSMGVSSYLNWFCSLERAFIHWIFIVWISPLLNK